MTKINGILQILVLGCFAFYTLANPEKNDYHENGAQLYPSPPPKIILDCDPAGMILTGFDVDDDLAVLNAMSLHTKGHIDLLGITITGGNAPLPYTYYNAFELVHKMAGIKNDENGFGIYQGHKPLTGDESLEALKSDAVNFIVDSIMNSPGNTITLLCIGPLTNLASAMIVEPKISRKIKAIVSMGGTITPGLPYDLNIRTDPKATSIVWSNKDVLKVVIPIETCIQAIFGNYQLQQVEQSCLESRANPSIICDYLVRLRLQILAMPWLVNHRYAPKLENQSMTQHIDDGFILWDLVALWACIRPAIFDDWAEFEVLFSPTTHESFFADGPKIHISRSHSIMKVDKLQDLSRRGDYDTIFIPMTLKNETHLHELIIGNLFMIRTSNRSSLNFWIRLGKLPKFLASGVAVVLGICALRKVRAERLD